MSDSKEYVEACLRRHQKRAERLGIKASSKPVEKPKAQPRDMGLFNQLNRIMSGRKLFMVRGRSFWR